MHIEGSSKGLRSMSAHNISEVAFQFVAEFGMRAISYDETGAFLGVFAAQVGHSLFGDNYLNGMLAMIQVATQRNDWTDLASFCRAGTRENRDVGVARKVPTSANAVHHVVAHDMSRIHVAENIDFNSGVNGNDSKSTYDFWVVGNLLRPQNHASAEKV